MLPVFSEQGERPRHDWSTPKGALSKQSVLATLAGSPHGSCRCLQAGCTGKGTCLKNTEKVNSSGLSVQVSRVNKGGERPGVTLDVGLQHAGHDGLISRRERPAGHGGRGGLPGSSGASDGQPPKGWGTGQSRRSELRCISHQGRKVLLGLLQSYYVRCRD